MNRRLAMNHIYIFTLSIVLCLWATVHSENLDEEFEVIISNNTEEDLDTRRHYGLSVHDQCKNYTKTFKCLRACKIRGYEVFRMNYACKCTCHPMTLSEKKHFSPKVHRTTAKLPATIFPWTTLTPPTVDAKEKPKKTSENKAVNEKTVKETVGKGDEKKLLKVEKGVSHEDVESMTEEAPAESAPEAEAEAAPEADAEAAPGTEAEAAAEAEPEAAVEAETGE